MAEKKPFNLAALISWALVLTGVIFLALGSPVVFSPHKPDDAQFAFWVHKIWFGTDAAILGVIMLIYDSRQRKKNISRVKL